MLKGIKERREAWKGGRGGGSGVGKKEGRGEKTWVRDRRGLGGFSVSPGDLRLSLQHLGRKLSVC